MCDRRNHIHHIVDLARTLTQQLNFPGGGLHVFLNTPHAFNRLLYRITPTLCCLACPTRYSVEGERTFSDLTARISPMLNFDGSLGHLMYLLVCTLYQVGHALRCFG